MAEIDAPKNNTVITVDALIHNAIMEVASRAAIAAAINAAPWLKLPIISTIFSWAVNYAFSFFSKIIEQTAAFNIIDTQTDAEAKSYRLAIDQLRTAQKSGDPHDLEMATTSFKNSLSKLIHFDGS